MKKLNVRRLVKFIVSVIYIVFVIVSMFHHNIKLVSDLFNELELYALMYVTLYLIMDNFKFSEFKQLFINK